MASTPAKYRRYLASASAEFTAIKGVDVIWQTGWLSDRAAAFLALGRPGDHGRYRSGKISSDSRAECSSSRRITEAAAAARRVLGDWEHFRGRPAECAVEVFDSAKNLRKILGL